MPHIETLRTVALLVLCSGLLVVLALLWAHPYTNARKLGHPHARSIFLLMVLGLITGLPWLVALVWSYFPARPAALQVPAPAGRYVRCPTCNVGSYVPREATATRCPNCQTFTSLAERSAPVVRPVPPDVDALLAETEFDRWRQQQHRAG